LVKNVLFIFWMTQTILNTFFKTLFGQHSHIII